MRVSEKEFLTFNSETYFEWMPACSMETLVELAGFLYGYLYTMGKSDYVIVYGDFGYWSEDLYADFCDKMVRVKTIYRQEPVYKERTSILRKMELQKIK